MTIFLASYLNSSFQPVGHVMFLFSSWTLTIFILSDWFSPLCLQMQSESTLWRLKFFVKSALEDQAKSAAMKGNDNNKRKRENCDALAKTARKRSKKLSA